MNRKYILPINNKMLRILYIDYGYSMSRIGRMLHTSCAPISRHVGIYKIKKRPARFCYHKINIDEDVLRDLYIDQRKSSREIADDFKIDHSVVLRRLQEFDIPIRSLSEAFKGKHKSPNTEFKKGEKPSWKNTEIEEMVKQKISENRVGDKNPNWQGGIQKYVDAAEFREIRKIALRRDKNICQLCGAMDKKLQVHHIVPYRVSMDNSLSNLISLCSPCHTKVEGYYRKNPNTYMDIFYGAWSCLGY